MMVMKGQYVRFIGLMYCDDQTTFLIGVGSHLPGLQAKCVRHELVASAKNSGQPNSQGLVARKCVARLDADVAEGQIMISKSQ